MDDRNWKTLLKRKDNSNKYDYGHVLIIGGSEGMVGAPLLAGRGALRVGAGLVTVASTPGVIERVGVEVEEIMTMTLGDWGESTVGAITDYIQRRHVSVVVIGPGLAKDSFVMIRKLTEACSLPIVIDAGALAAFDGHLDDLRRATVRNSKVTMTPHTGEYARLGDDTTPADFAHDFGVTLILKGSETTVYAASGATYQNHTGNPGLATAGTGDVLTGMIAGIVAQGLDVFEAATMAVYLHGLAGDYAEKDMTEPGMTASDVIESIPNALRQIDTSVS